MSLQQLIIEAKALLGESGVITDAQYMAHYTTSMRHRHVVPTPMVALPQSTEQVAMLVRLCRQHGVAMVPQGGNTGLVEGGLPREGQQEIIINLSRMNKIRDIDAAGMIATVEAGIILQQLHEIAAAHDLMFPLWIASEGSAEIGGLIATNAGGLAALRYGTMRNLVLGVEAVLPNGEVVSTLKNLVKDNTGYHLASLFGGSEGTLGIVTAATLRLLPATRQKVTSVVAVADIEAALELLAAFRREAAEHLSAFEFMSLAALQLAVKNVHATRFPGDTQDAPYYVLVELSASSNAVPLREMLEAVLTPAFEAGKALDAAIAENETQTKQFWHIREHIPEALRVEKQRLHFDIGVPIRNLAGFLAKTGTIIQSEFPDVVLMPFGHIGDGNVHYNMYMPTMQDVDQLATIKARIQDIVFDAVQQWDGTISAEHGIGTERKDVLVKVKSKAELDLMRTIKRAMDPDQMMNPGKIFD